MGKADDDAWLTCTHALVVIYLQIASLKAVGLISREETMVVSGENHLRWKRCGKHRTRKDSKEGKTVKRQRGKESNGE